MDAKSFLERQHEELRGLFRRLERAKNQDRARIFDELGAEIVAHDAIEREIFYPACEKEMGMTDLLGEALVEHGVVEFMLYLADEAQGEDDFEPKVTVLKESIEHHVKEEEQELFPKVEKALGAELLAQLGEEMEARFEEVKADDFRGPLHDNLRQVLEGATETVPESAKKAKKPTAKKTAKKTTRKAAGAAH
jgi:hypothetical protein